MKRLMMAALAAACLTAAIFASQVFARGGVSSGSAPIRTFGAYVNIATEDQIFAGFEPAEDITIVRMEVTWGSTGTGGSTGTVVRLTCSTGSLDCTAACNTAAGTVINCDVTDTVCAGGTDVTLEVDSTTDCSGGAGNPDEINVVVTYR